MATHTRTPATLDDLSRVDGKAELIDGEIVHLMSSGFLPSQIALMIAMSLHVYAKRNGLGVAFGDGVGYALATPLMGGRQSFSPDASLYSGPVPSNPMRFIPGIPIFAVEVRSENDYGPAAERDMKAKWADYFEAGTLVVWDVDPIAMTVAVYRDPSLTPDHVYQAGEVAEAEPAVPGWRCPVDELFQ
ncbi:Uma2 family endonuclease [Tundrisphaera sp. TA3]|uniref:Uma2 family endonuclease n=1 Tax=Tundrisphaera sp. TA3 TaxID=3435775 RepID=UPI003EBF1549